MPRVAPSHDVLEKSIDGFIYCLGQLFSYFHWGNHIESNLRKHCKEEIDAKKAQIVENITIEGTLLFMRKVEDFFRPRPQKDEESDDLRAYDFPGYSGAGWIFSKNKRVEINKHVAHVTTRGVTHGKVDWKIFEGVEIICQKAFPFLDYLTEDFLKDNTEKSEALKRKKALLSEYRNLNIQWIKTNRTS